MPDPHPAPGPPADPVTVGYDRASGRLRAGPDPRADAVLQRHWPGRDVVAAWAERGVTARFADHLAQAVYASGLARAAPPIPVPGLAVPLYDHQARTVATALPLPGILVADEPGLGKTPTGIAYAHSLLAARRAPRAVVVVPAPLRTGWAQEIARFTGCPQAAVVTVSGDRARRARAYQAAQDVPWLVVHYDVLHTDLAAIRPLAADAVVLFDEAHRARDGRTQRGRAARVLARTAAARMTLTGTPVDNSPAELHGLMALTVPGLLGGFPAFADRYMYPGRFGGWDGARRLGELRDRLAPFLVRNTKADVAPHLPPLRTQHLPLDPDPAYAAALRRVHAQAKDEIKAAATGRSARWRAALFGPLDGPALDGIDAAADMTAVGMLRLLLSSPRLLHASPAPAARALVDAGLVPDIDGPKVDELRIWAAEAAQSGQRLVVFTGFRSMADLVSARLTEDGVRHVTYTGATRQADRDAAVAAFTDPAPGGPTVFVSTDAGAEGLNLAAGGATTVLNLDLAWTPGRMTQRAQRIHRITGTAGACRVVNLTVHGSLEDGVLRMLAGKAGLGDVVLGESGGGLRVTGREYRRAVLDVLLA